MKWGINFMTCNPHSTSGHGYIMVGVDYFTKWAEVMPKFSNTSETTAYVFPDHFIALFRVLQDIDMNHRKHFQNHMMIELTVMLGLSVKFQPLLP